jgi:hypothetical protein
MRLCSVDGCERTHFALGYCRKHHARFRKFGDPTVVKLVRSERPHPICMIPGCGRDHFGGGYCAMHKARVGSTGDPHTVKKVARGDSEFCKVDGCGERYRARGYCWTHFLRLRRIGSLDLPEREDRRCSADGCDRRHYGRDLCYSHLYRLKKYGEPGVIPEDKWDRRWRPRRGEAHPYWAGGSYQTAHKRVRGRNGPASDHTCVDCAGPAREWSYDHSDPNQCISARGRPYSWNIDCYQPRCRPCHRTMDHAILRKRRDGPEAS